MTNLPDMKGKVVLGICAHPDDLDFGCSGTMAHWIKMGATGYYLILTDGTKGSEDMSITNEELKMIRREEQTKAGEILGLSKVFFLNEEDGELANTPSVRKQVIKIIRSVKPDVVITTDPTRIFDIERGYINHPDHIMAGQIALNCVFPFARNSRTFPELLEEELESHHVKQVLLINSNNSNFYVDITDSIETKLDALAQHKSQQDDPQGTRERVYNRAKDMGSKQNFEFAEGFLKIDIGS
jgi:LmbE family N-acetylglucosaminyl deacetylase